MKTTDPTPTQRRAIRYFNGDIAAAQGRPLSHATYQACERKGWIEQIDVWPYHQATRNGAEAVDMAYAPKVDSETREPVQVATEDLCIGNSISGAGVITNVIQDPDNTRAIVQIQGKDGGRVAVHEIPYGIKLRVDKAAEPSAEGETARPTDPEDADTGTGTPTIGQGATEHLFSDKHGYVVVDVTKTGKTVTLAPLLDPDKSTGHQAARECNGFPVWDHQYTYAELTSMRRSGARTVRARRHKDGQYYAHGARFTFNGARYYRNWAE